MILSENMSLIISFTAELGDKMLINVCCFPGTSDVEFHSCVLG